MGYFRHDAIVVTSFDQGHALRAHEEAKRIFKNSLVEVTDVTSPAVNGYCSFLVAPDGSKEGWTESDAMDVRREQLITWLRDAWRRDIFVDWVAVNFGGDDDDVIRVEVDEGSAQIQIPEQPR